MTKEELDALEACFDADGVFRVSHDAGRALLEAACDLPLVEQDMRKAIDGARALEAERDALRAKLDEVRSACAALEAANDPENSTGIFSADCARARDAMTRLVRACGDVE